MAGACVQNAEGKKILMLRKNETHQDMGSRGWPSGQDAGLVHYSLCGLRSISAGKAGIFLVNKGALD